MTLDLGILVKVEDAKLKVQMLILMSFLKRSPIFMFVRL
jgi:hypothetical protein